MHDPRAVGPQIRFLHSAIPADGTPGKLVQKAFCAAMQARKEAVAILAPEGFDWAAGHPRRARQLVATALRDRRAADASPSRTMRAIRSRRRG